MKKDFIIKKDSTMKKDFIIKKDSTMKKVSIMKKVFNMKAGSFRKQRRGITLQLLLILSVMTACGGKQDQETDAAGLGGPEGYEVEISSSPEIGEQEDEGGTLHMTPEADQSFPVSDVEAVVPYEGGDFRKSVFCVGADMLYLYGTKPDETSFLGYMKQEDTQFLEVSPELPEDMRAAYMTTDRGGNCHIMWISVEALDVNGVTQYRRTFEKIRITVVDRDGRLKTDTDLSEVFRTEEIRPSYTCFTVDNQGCYYLASKQEIIKCDGEGKPEGRIPCDGILQALGCGRSGDIYCIYAAGDGRELLGRVEQGEEGLRMVSCGVSLPSADALYLDMAAGADAELLFYNKAGGVYAYDEAAGTLEQRIAPEEMPVSGMNVDACGFLGDGRLCLLTRENDVPVFYYLPAGRKSGEAGK